MGELRGRGLSRHGKNVAESNFAARAKQPSGKHRSLLTKICGSTGLAAIYHVVEHFGMHCGQILYVTKLLNGTRFGILQATQWLGVQYPDGRLKDAPQGADHYG
jgi:hypothetical protein